MNRLLLIFTALIFTIIASTANDNAPSQEERQRWMREMVEYKHEFLIKELGLTAEQQERFLPLYDRMEQQKRELEKQTRELEKAVENKGDKASDLEYEKAAEAMFELQRKCADIELEHYRLFKAELTPAQLFKLKKTERRFMRKIMDHRRKNTSR